MRTRCGVPRRCGRGVLTALLPALLVGCAAVDHRAGVAEVERMVAARGVSATTSADDGADVERTIDALLADELSVESAVRVALLNNRGLRALYEGLGVEEAELAQAGLLPNPILTANVRFGVGPSGTGAELGLVQNLISALQIPLRKRVAGAALERAKLEVADAVLKLAFDTRAAFFKEQGALQTLALRRTAEQAAGIAREIAERQHAAGNISDLELAAERARHEESKLELAGADATVAAQREDLNTLLGLWGRRTGWRIAASLPAVPDDDAPASGLETLAVAQRLDLEAARAGSLAALAQYRVGRFYGLAPQASLGVVSEREIEGGIWSVGPALDVPIPVFDQSQAQLAGSAARVRASDERYAALAVAIRADVRRAHARLAAAQATARHYQTVVVPLAARLVEETQREYNAMLVGVFRLLQAKRDEIETRRRWVESATDYWIGRTELERAVGGALQLASASTPATSASPPAAHDRSQRHHHGD